MNRKIIIVMIMLILVSCETFSSSELNKIDEEATIENTPALELSDTPESDDSLSSEELEPLIRSGILTWAVCKGVIDTAKKVENNEIDGYEAFGEILGNGAILKATEDGLSEWNEPSSLTSYKQAIQSHIDEIQNVMSQWSDEKISSSDISDLLSQECVDAQHTINEIVDIAKDNGITQDDIEAMIEEMEKSLEELESEIDQPEP